MKKVFMLILLMVFMTGCSATYNLELKNGYVKENFKATGVSSEETKNFINNPISVSVKDPCFLDYDVDGIKEDAKEVEGIRYYDVSHRGDTIELSSRLPFHQYKDSRLANVLFNKMNINNYSDLKTIYGFDGLLVFKMFPTLDKLTVNITVDKKVTDHNADKVSDNTYTWYFDKNTDDNKTLLLEMDNKKAEKNSGFGSFIKNNILLILILEIRLSIMILIKIIFI